ncbi:MAG: diguanylate cyclase [Anaerolineaceae bacterium]|nr:diguanylate cyclase [Anaerolineaceae bacterium]
MQYVIFLILAPITVLISFWLLSRQWKESKSDNFRFLFFFILSTSGWMIFNSFELLAKSAEYTIFWAKITYIFLNSCIISWVALAIKISINKFPFKRIYFILLSIIPALTIFFVFTNEKHHLIWEHIYFNSGPFLAMQVQHGPWFWIHLVYAYFFMVMGSFFIIRKYYSSFSIFRVQSSRLITASLLPILINLIYIFKIIPDFTKDYSSIAFGISGIILCLGIFQHQSLELSPIALNTIITKISDGLIIINQEHNIISTNPAVEKLFGENDKQTFGKPLLKYIKNWNSIFKMVVDKDINNFEIVLTIDGKRRFFELKVSSLDTQRNQPVGWLIIIHEITERVTFLDVLHKLAIKDPLTGIPNRRHFFDLAEKEFWRSKRYKHALSIIVLDIDHFKLVNDNFGHLLGDNVLKNLAEFCSSFLRKTDTVARYGGEEFVILLPETTEEHACQIADRLRESVSKKPLNEKKEKVYITISIGVASLEDDPLLNVDKILDRADKAMYHSKQNGRNKTTSWTSIAS